MAVQACRTCIGAGRTCDGAKPVCKTCAKHLESLCSWSVPPPIAQPITSTFPENQRLGVDGYGVGLGGNHYEPPSTAIRYQIPLQYCMSDGAAEDRIIQYFIFHAKRQGLLPGPQTDRQIDPIDMIQQAKTSAASIHALLALAAAICPSDGLEVYHYSQAMREIRQRVSSEGYGQGVVSAIGLLHFYELHKSGDSLPSRVHLSGLSQVLNNELQSRPQAITNLVPALQRYIYHTATNALFDPSMAEPSVSYDTVEEWGRYISGSAGRTSSDHFEVLCVSVPLALLACAYRLSLLNSHPNISTWLQHLEMIRRTLVEWNSLHQIWSPSGGAINGVEIIGRLYHSACCILFQSLIESRRMPPAYEIQHLLTQAFPDLQTLSNLQFPYHVTAWPLLIHGFAATDRAHGAVISLALTKMDMNAHITSVRHAVRLLETVWYTNIGLEVLSRPDMLSPILL